jgi:superfamily II DNA helicase RecQ
MLQKGNEDRQQMPGGSKSIERAIANINACAEFCMNEIDCRRSLILKYFGETFPSELCKGTCDNCRRSAGSVCREDFTDQGKQATSIVKSIVDEGLPKLTLNMLTQLMSNSKEKRLERYRNVLGERAVVKLGNGKPIAKALCSRLLQTMVLMDFLREDSQVTMGQYTAEYIVLGNRAMQLLQNNSFNSRNECPIILFVPQRGRSAETVAGDDLDDEDAMLEQIDVPVVSKPLDKASGLVVKDSKIGNKSDSYSVPNKRSDATGLGKTFAEPFSKTIPSSPLPPKGATSKSTSLPVRTKPVEIIDDSDEDDAFSPYVVGKRKRSNLIMTQSSGASSPMVEAQTSAQVGGKLTSQLRTELRKWLNSYRERWENYWVYLNNSSIAEMTERVPVTLSELSEIGGFGEQKIKMHGTHILATMWAFLNKHNLLSAYPKATRPTIRECPTWMDPCSREAEAIRSEAIALSRQKQKANFTTASFSPSVPRVKEESPGKSTFNASPFAANEIEDVMEYLV